MEAIDTSIVLEFLRLPARMERRSQFGRFPGIPPHCHVLTCMLELRTDVQNRTASSVVQKRTAENLEITKNVVQCTSRKGAVRKLGSLLT
jgi:hypothetical protein